MAEEVKKKKPGFFTRLLYTTESTTEVNKTPEDEIKVTNTGAQNIPAVTETLNIPITGDGVFDKKFGDALQQTIADNNIPGVDYFEFNQALKAMVGAGLNESVGFQTVFTTLKVTDPSLTKEKLLSSIDHYIGVLKIEEKEFKAEVAKKIEEDVTSRRNKVVALNEENHKLVQQIQTINEQIAKNQEQSILLNSEASGIEATVGQSNKNFITTLTHVVAGLETDKLKIGQLVKE